MCSAAEFLVEADVRGDIRAEVVVVFEARAEFQRISVTELPVVLEEECLRDGGYIHWDVAAHLMDFLLRPEEAADEHVLVVEHPEPLPLEGVAAQVMIVLGVKAAFRL